MSHRRSAWNAALSAAGTHADVLTPVWPSDGFRHQLLVAMIMAPPSTERSLPDILTLSTALATLLATSTASSSAVSESPHQLGIEVASRGRPVGCDDSADDLFDRAIEEPGGVAPEGRPQAHCPYLRAQEWEHLSSCHAPMLPRTAPGTRRTPRRCSTAYANHVWVVFGLTHRLEVSHVDIKLLMYGAAFDVGACFQAESDAAHQLLRWERPFSRYREAPLRWL